MISTLQMRKQALRESKEEGQGDTDRKWQTQCLGLFS